MWYGLPTSVAEFTLAEVNERLAARGLSVTREDYRMLAERRAEARWIARFDVEGCIAVLERTCPDYRGLHVNLYDLLLPHERKLLITSVRNG